MFAGLAGKLANVARARNEPGPLDRRESGATGQMAKQGVFGCCGKRAAMEAHGAAVAEESVASSCEIAPCVEARGHGSLDAIA